jgi:hypothetical protein
MNAADPDDGYPGAVFCAATGKVRHPSRKVAAENLKRFLAKLDVKGRDRRAMGRLNVYRCEHCSGGWHCGNQEPDLLRSRRARRRRPEVDDREEAA